MLELHLVGPAGTRRLAEIGRAPLLVGRAVANDVVLDDEHVSSRHLRVWRDDDHVRVRDLGSRAGTSLNGRRIAEEAEARPGDEIALGRRVTLRVVQIAGPGPEALRWAVTFLPRLVAARGRDELSAVLQAALAEDPAPEHLEALRDLARPFLARPENHDEDLQRATTAFQLRRVHEVLTDCGGNRAEAARRLGVSRQFVYRLLAKEET
jgi:hypothetical protein